jgi:hypothetical protein
MFGQGKGPPVPRHRRNPRRGYDEGREIEDELAALRGLTRRR